MQRPPRSSVFAMAASSPRWFAHPVIFSNMERAIRRVLTSPGGPGRSLYLSRKTTSLLCEILTAVETLYQKPPVYYKGSTGALVLESFLLGDKI